MANPGPPPLFSLRTAVVLLLGVACGGVVGVLTAATGAAAAVTALASVTTAGATTVFFHKVVGLDRGP